MKKTKIVQITFNHQRGIYNIFTEDEYVVSYCDNTNKFTYRSWGEIDNNFPIPNIIEDEMYFQGLFIWDYRYLDIDLMRLIQIRIRDGLLPHSSTLNDEEEFKSINNTSILFEYETKDI